MIDIDISVSNVAPAYPVSIIETMKSSPYSPHYDKLSAWLKQQRENSGMTLREAAEVMERHHSVLGKMEQERRKIEILEFVKYCRVLGADPHEGLDILIKSINTNND